MADYRIGIENVLRTYGTQPALLVRALQSLIDTAIENERGKLTLEIQASLATPACPQCNQALAAEQAENVLARARAMQNAPLASTSVFTTPWVAPQPQSTFKPKRSYRKHNEEYWTIFGKHNPGAKKKKKE